MPNNTDSFVGTKFQTLKPWVKGNNSVTPAHFYRDYKIVFNNHIFVALDIKIPLYKANTVDTSNILSVRSKNTQYIKKASAALFLSLVIQIILSFTLPTEHRYHPQKEHHVSGLSGAVRLHRRQSLVSMCRCCNTRIMLSADQRNRFLPAASYPHNM